MKNAVRGLDGKLHVVITAGLAEGRRAGGAGDRRKLACSWEKRRGWLKVE